MNFKDKIRSYEENLSILKCDIARTNSELKLEKENYF